MATLSKKDIEYITSTGRRAEDVMAQIDILLKGRRFIELDSAATVENGRITRLNTSEFGGLQRLWKEKVAPHATKFIPASGAATRMFGFIAKVYSEGVENIKNASSPDFIKFWNALPTFPFYADLGTVLKKNGIDIEAERGAGRIRDIIKYLLEPCGLSYSNQPKLFLKFHIDNGNPRLALEEHIKEAVWLTGGNIHFTVSEDVLDKAKHIAAELTERYAKKGHKISVSFSLQHKGTDVVAMVPGKDELHRNADGTLFFRQGGHGALIGNLNLLKEDYILIQNVDNLPGGDEDILGWKRAFMGYFYKRLEAERLNGLDRPLIVIAVVPNKGEPGGGPFVVRDKETGELSLQVVEQVQIDTSDPGQKKILVSSTHFSPVFMILNSKDPFGKRFDLIKFGKKGFGYAFFTEKRDHKGDSFVSFDTGLWNGEMAEMFKVFVEMPIETFGPAKTVLDLSPDIRPFRKNPYKEIIA